MCEKDRSPRISEEQTKSKLPRQEDGKKPKEKRVDISDLLPAGYIRTWVNRFTDFYDPNCDEKSRGK